MEGSPPSLKERVLRAVAEAPAEARSDALAGTPGSAGTHLALVVFFRHTGEQLLREAKAEPPSYDTALTLLAADALITFACEAQADGAPEGLAGLR